MCKINAINRHKYKVSFERKIYVLFSRKHSLGCNIHGRLEKLYIFHKFVSSLLFIAYFMSKGARFAIYYSWKKNHEKLFASNEKGRRRRKLSDNSTCLSYREVIKGTAKVFVCRRVKREAKSWSFCQIHLGVSIKWSIGSHRGTYQPFKISRLRKSRTTVFPLPSGASHTYSSLIDTRGFTTTAEYVSNCSCNNWSWILLCRMPFKIECNAEPSKIGDTCALASE